VVSQLNFTCCSKKPEVSHILHYIDVLGSLRHLKQQEISVCGHVKKVIRVRFRSGLRHVKVYLLTCKLGATADPKSAHHGG